MADTPTSEKLYCAVHPTVETTLRCNKCGRLMCTRCAVLTPVGYRCKECVRGQQQGFYNSQPTDPIIQAAISLVLGAVGAVLVGFIGGGLGFIGWLIAFAGASVAGGLIADLVHRAVGRRRGRYSWLVVAAGIVIGAVVVALIPGALMALFLLQAAQAAPEAPVAPLGVGGLLSVFVGFGSIGWWIYVVVATGAAIGRLRLGK